MSSATASSLPARFTKRTFTPGLFVRSWSSAVIRLPTLIRALIAPRTSRALREQVMLAVTSVNGCRYCSWLHTGLALENGVDLTELQSILESEGIHVHETPEAVAILFAKHFADTVRQPSAAAVKSLEQVFTPAQKREVMAYIHAIYIGNLSGNSLDAWLARLRGQPVDTGNPVTEAVAATLALPVLLAIRWANRSKH
ncbi:carboxymuconolactone decarboxylase family protein [Aquabacterium parvum]|uniref:carboxymuconolactone decarboxylase family protein n=1 Tax=Aquabacterium parvum TaxID=70584 RepID=UPI0013664D5B|nr:carboxymuconolactone decarboxylase family protein [Aquabacterium parvum]